MKYRKIYKSYDSIKNIVRIFINHFLSRPVQPAKPVTVQRRGKVPSTKL